MGEGLGPLFCVSPAHMSHLLSAAVCGNDTTNRERAGLLFAISSSSFPFVSVGSPTVMWGSYRLFIAVGVFFFFFFGPHGASVIFLSAARKRGQTCVKTVQCISAPRSTCTQINHLSSAVGGIGLLSSLQFAVAFNFHIPQRFLWDCTH